MQNLPLKDRLRLMPFRFIALYLVFYIWPFPFHFIPGAHFILTPISSITTKIIDITGAIILGKLYNPIHVVTGSGDTSFQYAQVFFFFVLALVVSFIWSVLDRKHSSYKKLPIALNILVQFYVAAILLDYGFLKIFPLQFPSPPLSRLGQTYGESSPMGLLWTFMGSSKLYSAFTGACEVFAGAGLLFRKTKLPAAILAAFVFMHILILNLSYDVPVKLFSFHLLLMSLFLIKPYTKKIIAAFTIENTPAIWPVENAKKYRWLLVGMKIILIYFIFVEPFFYAFKRNTELNQSIEQSTNEMLQTYEVLSIEGNNQTPNTQTHLPKWKMIKLMGNLMETTYADGVSLQWYCVKLGRSQILKVASKDLSTFGELKFTRHKDNVLLVGILNQDSITISARQTSSHTSPPLLNRGVHWISEEPFNR
jgi:hypothetical protein